MKREKFIAFFLGIIFILFFISGVSATCIDHDGSDKYIASYAEGTSVPPYLLGKTLLSNGTIVSNSLNIHIRYDRCIFDGAEVQESTCLYYAGEDHLVYLQFVCENGCENGACIGANSLPEVPYYCDSDHDGYNSIIQSGTSSELPFGCSNLAGDDCNDEDSTIFPGNPEICDNKDNNCNGVIDEGCGECISGGTISCGTNIGLCQTGLKTCVNGAWGTCVGAIYPEEEVCDVLDHNCDGSFHLTNTGSPISRTTTCGVGICSQNQGQQYCLPSGTWGLNTCNQFSGATTELCNDNLDNDCDGLMDCADIIDCSSSPDCASCECTLEGECNPTNNGQKCDGCNYYSVSNVTEICDLLDDNCDGSLTEDPIGFPLSQLTNCGFGLCSNSGFEFCQLNGSFGANNCQALPSNYSTEQNCSDGIDEDCDGLTDCEDTQNCGSLQECGGCECSAGCHPTTPGYVCDGCNYVEATGGDVCDGQDNDCDGVVDEGEDNNLLWTECYTGPSSTLGLGRCTYGFSYCTNGEYDSCIGQKLPVTEICNNGIDDNCNGLTDCDDGELCEGMPGCEICVEGECNPNNNGKRCIGGQYVSVNDEEVCDGVDNNCDGNIDKEPNGVALNQECYDGPFATQEVGICETGTSYCINGNYGGCIGQVLPSLELCNNELDDDCDGLEDLEDLEDCEGVLEKYYCDNDADSYFSELFSGEGEVPAGCSESEGNDCNDYNSAVNLGAEEICDNGIDDDCDGNSDCNDEECFGVGECGCIENDLGYAHRFNQNPYILDSSDNFEEVCVDGEILKEYFCENGELNFEEIKLTGLSHIDLDCSEGRLVPGISRGGIEAHSCFDLDLGINPGEIGALFYGDINNFSERFNPENIFSLDTCLDENTLYEGYCDGNYMAGIKMECGLNEVCVTTMENLYGAIPVYVPQPGVCVEDVFTCEGVINPFGTSSDRIWKLRGGLKVNYTSGFCLDENTFSLPVCDGETIEYLNQSCDNNVWGLDASCINNSCKLISEFPGERLGFSSEEYNGGSMGILAFSPSSATFEFGGETKNIAAAVPIYNEGENFGKIEYAGTFAWSNEGFSPIQAGSSIAFGDEFSIPGKGGFQSGDEINYRFMDFTGEVYKADAIYSPEFATQNKWYPLGMYKIIGWENIIPVTRYSCDKDNDGYFSNHFYEGDYFECQSDEECSSNNCLEGICVSENCILELGIDCDDSDSQINPAITPVVFAGEDIEINNNSVPANNLISIEDYFIEGYSEGNYWTEDGRGEIIESWEGGIKKIKYKVYGLEVRRGGIINIVLHAKGCGGGEVTDTLVLTITKN